MIIKVLIFVILDIDECQSSPCINGECINLYGSYQCVCNDDDMTGRNCEQSKLIFVHKNH